MKVLIACEFSGTVRDAFIAKGHEAWSCDILPTEATGNHLQCDVLDVINDGWDMIIAHPPCTRLANSGVRWLNERNLWHKLEAAIEFFNKIGNADCPKIARENPIPHKYAVQGIEGRQGIGKYDQIIQPYQFGHTTSKATCLWLKGLPLLRSTQLIPKSSITYEIHKASPTENRWKARSKTFQGIADAMADQWG